MSGYHPIAKTHEWETPQWLFDELDREFLFTMDVAASDSNHKCAAYWSKEDDALSKNWSGLISVFCNPPYSRNVGRWIEKAVEAARSGTTVVMLIPVRTDTAWFHDHINQKPGVEIRFLRRRLQFGGRKEQAPFPSMVVIFYGSI